MNTQRCLKAIMFTDIVGYTSLMAEDEERALQLLQTSRQIHSSTISQFQGTLLKEIGDGTLSSFTSCVAAVECAKQIQYQYDIELPEFKLRIGVHLGDVIDEGNDLIGDGVNVASRLEQQAKPGQIIVSNSVKDALKSHPEIKLRYIGLKKLKGIKAEKKLYLVNSASSKAELQDSLGSFYERYTSKVSNPWLVSFVFIGALLMTWFLATESASTLQKKQQLAQPNVSTPNKIEQQPTIILMPFADLSEDQSLNYLVLGLTEEIANNLINIKEVKLLVADSNSTYSSSAETYLLKGSIRKSGDQLRVTAKLVDSNTKQQLMANNFDYQFKDLFKFHDEISLKIINSLNLSVSEESKKLVSFEQKVSADSFNYYLIGMSLLSDNLTEKNLADAKLNFEQALTLEPSYGKAYAGLCRTYAYSHDYFSTSSSELLSDAEEACNKARSLAPSLIESYIAQAILYRETSNYEQAIQLLQIALSKNPNSVDTLLELGRTYREAQNLEKCEEYLLAAIKLQPGNAKIYNQLGLAYLFFGAIDSAKNMFKKTIEIDPHNISGFNNLGTLYMFETKFEQADFYFRRSLELDPKASTYSNRASVLYYLGRFEEALPYYQKVVSLSGTDHFNWSSLADCHVQLGNITKANTAYQEAIKHAEAELKNSPKDITTLNMLGYYYARIGDISKAQNYRDLSLASSPEDMYIYYYASLINMILGEKDKAISDLQIAINKGFDTRLISVAPELAELRQHNSFLALINNEELD